MAEKGSPPWTLSATGRLDPLGGRSDAGDGNDQQLRERGRPGRRRGHEGTIAHNRERKLEVGWHESRSVLQGVVGPQPEAFYEFVDFDKRIRL
jgi:hypothetical protein